VVDVLIACNGESTTMARLSINEMTTYRWPFEMDVERLAAAGVPAIGAWRQKVVDCGEEKAVRLLADHGLAVSNLLWAGGFTGSDGCSFQDSLEDAAEAIRLAGALRAGCLVVYTGARAGHTHSHARRLTRDALRELAPLAERHGVTLCIEPMHASFAGEWTFLSSIKDAIELIEAVESPGIKLAYDTYHFGLDVCSRQLSAWAPFIGIVHLGDCRATPNGEMNRCRLGDGIVPLRENIAALLSGGYRGDFDVELLGEEVETADYSELITHSKAMFEQLLDCQPA
jgi:sugar phosphate isomerase/epimerase